MEQKLITVQFWLFKFQGLEVLLDTLMLGSQILLPHELNQFVAEELLTQLDGVFSEDLAEDIL